MPRPTQMPKRPALTKEQIEEAFYLGSQEHKIVRWWGGLPGAYIDKATGEPKRSGGQDTTPCPLVTEADRSKATGWVKAALRARQFRYFEGDKTYPKHIWYFADDRYWFGFAVNQEAGTYKGWPISEAEKREAFD